MRDSLGVWKDIPGYEGYYQVSTGGRVKSVDREVIGIDGKTYKYRGKVLKQRLNHKGYPDVNLSKDRNYKTITTHILVAKTFINNPENKPQVNHIDADKTNNNVNNLEWVTNKENMIHASKKGLLNNKHENNPNAILNIKEVLEITYLLKRNVPIKKIANKYKVSIHCIYDIKRGKRWKGVTNL